MLRATLDLFPFGNARKGNSCEQIPLNLGMVLRVILDPTTIAFVVSHYLLSVKANRAQNVLSEGSTLIMVDLNVLLEFSYKSTVAM